MKNQLFTKVLSVFLIAVLALITIPIQTAEARPLSAITIPVTWTQAYNVAAGTGTGYNFATPNGANRILVVGITTNSDGSGTVGNPTTMTYGGQALTLATGNGATTGRMHTWLYYLKDTPAVMDNTSRPLNVTMGAAGGGYNFRNMTVFYAVYAGVDQAAAIATGNGLNNTGSVGPAQLSAALTVNAGQQAVYISSVHNDNDLTIPTYTLNANWTSTGNNTGTYNPAGNGNDRAWRNEVASSTVSPGNNAATSNIAPGGNIIRYAISAMTLPMAAVVGTPPTVTTQAVSAIGAATATGNGNITALGTPNPTQYGVVWDTAANPTVALATKTAQGPIAVTGAFTSTITGLIPSTLYHVRAYATNTAGTSYGADVTFTTAAPVAPTITTQAVTAITAATATGNGNITALGVPNPTQYGVVWDTAANPTVALATRTSQGPIAVTGAFTSAITGLTPSTLYHVRAYATNAAGTSYGVDVTFTTGAPVAPTVTTQAVTAITAATATGNGNITALGIPNPTQYGVVWDTAINPTVALATKTAQGPIAVTGAFTSAITGLTPSTLYHVRAYATNAAGTSYGVDVTFTTGAPVAPTVTTQAVTAITTTTATGNGNITALGIPSPTQYGVVWGIAANPTVALATKTAQGPIAVTGAFTSAITGLTPSTLYHVRAYATNAAGTSYGADVTFTTAAPVAPTVTTQAVTSITATTATGNGNITALGVPNPTQYGVVWDIAANPTVALATKTAQGPIAVTGAFTSAITGLTPGTTYHVRAYATNTANTSYGVDVTFTTPLAPTVTTQAVTAITTTTATGNGNITTLGVPNPTQYGVVWGIAANPTVALATKTAQGPIAVTGAFTSAITGLTPGTLYHVRAYATNTVGTSYGADVTFTTLAAPIITSLTPASGAVGIPYSHTFTATGNPAATFVLSGSALPAGLTFNGVNTISGIPTTAGTSGSITVTASNGVAPNATQTFTITIALPTITLAPVSLPDGTKSIAYNQTITASGGASPYTYAVTLGTLPSGLTLSTGGVLSGTPIAVGSFNFTVTATDSFSSTGSRAYTLIVNDLPSVTKVNSVTDTGDAQIIENEHTKVAVTQLLVVFNNAMNAVEVIDPANYGLLQNGATTIAINSVSYDGPTKTATLNINGAVALLDGTYALTVKSSLHDAAGYNPPSNFVRNFVIDTTAPQVVTNGINTITDTGDGVLAEFEIVTINLTQLTVTFSEDLTNVGSGDPLYAKSAINPANYMLVRDLGDAADFQTVSCRGGAVTPADTKIDISSVIYDNSTHTAIFAVNGGLPLSNGNYRVYVCGTTSITNLSGIELAGNGTTAGTDFIRNFVVSIANNGDSGNGNGKGNNGGKKTTTTATTPTLSTFLIPVTGFAPNQTTLLPAQPADKAYKPLNELRIEVPTLGINFPIMGVATSENTWDLTWLKDSVGYLEGSAYPTLAGNTVLSAHVTDANNNLGPFSDIKGMQLGQYIYIHAYGQKFIYQVQENSKILPTNTSAVFKHEEYDWLTLVTCEDYNTKTGAYNYRRMVRAVLISVISEK